MTFKIPVWGIRRKVVQINVNFSAEDTLQCAMRFSSDRGNIALILYKILSSMTIFVSSSVLQNQEEIATDATGAL